MPTYGYVYHVEIFRDPHLQRLQDHANQYLDECQELQVAIVSCTLQWLDNEYHLTIVLSIPVDKDQSND